MEEHFLKIIEAQQAVIRTLKTDKETWYCLYLEANAKEKELNEKILLIEGRIRSEIAQLQEQKKEERHEAV